MRSAAIGAAVGGGLVLLALALTADRGQVFAQQAAPQLRGDDGLIAFSTSLGENVEQLTVIDPSLRTMGVYHVDGANGTITLKSVRNIRWDLQLLELNPTSPRPQEIRRMLGVR